MISTERPSISAELRERFAQANNVLVLTGAGVSAESGVPTFRGGGFRQQFTGASLRMMRARPVSGVGIGQYYRMSPLFLSPQLGWAYGAENAHNYFLQIGGELGAYAAA